MNRFFAATMGCKINQYETQAICEAWEKQGAERSPFAGDADTILINSCAVTANAVRDLRRMVRRMNRENPTAGIVVTGCAAQVLEEEIRGLPGVTRVVAQDRKHELADGDLAISGYDRARAVVKVQDGCSHRCTFCIVPVTRGPSRSRDADEILAEIRRLLEGGFQEMILSGINLRHYGREFATALDFWGLINFLEKELAPEWAGRMRLRISSMEPGQLNAKALDVLGSSSLICPQLHLSLQSGDRDVLRRMGRGHYDPTRIADFLRDLSGVWPLFGLGADLLVGFPGESGENYINTYELCRELPLTYAHVFPYSIRPGTRAADMDGQVEDEIKVARAKKLRSLMAGKKSAFLEKLAALPRLDVLVQDEAGKGVCEFYAPCRFVQGAPVSPKSIAPTRPVGLEKGVILVDGVFDE